MDKRILTRTFTRSRGMKLLTGILLSSLVVPAMAGTIRHDTPVAEYRAFGGWDKLAPVGAIIGGSSEGYYGCSGTAISAHWMLTAAHCVDKATSIDFYQFVSTPIVALIGRVPTLLVAQIKIDAGCRALC